MTATDRRAVARATRDRRARARVNGVGDRRKYAEMLRTVAEHRGLNPAAVAHLRAEAERIDGEALADLAEAMREMGAVVV